MVAVAGYHGENNFEALQEYPDEDIQETITNFAAVSTAYHATFENITGINTHMQEHIDAQTSEINTLCKQVQQTNHKFMMMAVQDEQPTQKHYAPSEQKSAQGGGANHKRPNIG